jgi:hypothetical protein
VERFDRNVRAAQSALEQTPEVLNPVGVDLPVHILLGMVDNPMDELATKMSVGRKLIRDDGCAGRYVLRM